MSALQMLARDRTDWRPPITVPATDPYETGGWQPTRLWPDHLWMPVAATGVQLTPGYILHHRPYRDTSRILEVVTREHGRLSLFVRLCGVGAAVGTVG